MSYFDAIKRAVEKIVRKGEIIRFNLDQSKIRQVWYWVKTLKDQSCPHIFDLTLVKRYCTITNFSSMTERFQMRS